MTNEIEGLKVSLELVADKFQQGLSQVTQSCQKATGDISNSLKTLQQGLELFVGGYVIKQLANLVTSFDDMRVKVSVATGDIGAKFERTSQLMDQIMKNTDLSVKEISDFMITLRNTMGLTNQEIEKQYKMWEAWMDITGKGPEVLAQTDKALRAMGITTDEAKKQFLDFAIVIQRTTPLSLDSLLNTLGQAGPLFRALGMNVQQATAFLGMLANAGVDAENTTRALSYAIGKIKSPAELNALIDRIKTASTDFEAAHMAAEVFGQKAGAKLGPALRSGAKDMETLTKALEEGTGAFDDAAKVIEESVSEQLGQLKNQFNIIADDLLKKLLPNIKIIVGAFDNMSEGS